MCVCFQRSHYYCTDESSLSSSSSSSQNHHNPQVQCAALKVRILHWCEWKGWICSEHSTNTKQFVVQLWEQNFAISVLIKLQAKIYVLWLRQFSRPVTDILHRFTGHFAIVLSISHILYFYLSSWLQLSFCCLHMMLLAFSERKEWSVISKQETDKKIGKEMFARIIEPALKRQKEKL